jgi:hypothetical protein
MGRTGERGAEALKASPASRDRPHPEFVRDPDHVSLRKESWFVVAPLEPVRGKP